MDKRLKEYMAKFKPTADDGEKMLQIKEDFLILFENNNQISRWFMAMMDKMNSDDKRQKTLDNIIAKMVGERIELEKRIEGLENHLFRDSVGKYEK
tara:strand:+ start:1682 stop:1969 length:288 start_codon:yes stop_codon:yes gene_type:complete